MKRIAVLGAGSWGTALGVHFANAGHSVALWARRPEFALRLDQERENHDYLPGVSLPGNLHPCADLLATVPNDLVLMVVPSHGFREVLRRYLAGHPAGRPAVVVSATKGIEPETLARMSQVAAEEGEAAGVPISFAVLSGPSFAAELAVNAPTAAVVASSDAALAEELRETLSTPWFRLYSSADVAGVELGGTAKNVIAIAAGVVTGLGLGHNTQAVLITRGLHEITRLGLAFGGEVRTFAGLSGLGDLVLTCNGALSRNRQIGIELAKGRQLDEVLGSTQRVAEGVRNSVAVAALARGRQVEMPITEQMVKVLYQGQAPKRAVEELMTRDLKAESEL